MRKGETAKIRIKKKAAFGRPGERDSIRWPQGYGPQSTQDHEKLNSKAVIYEVTLHDWIERTDI